MVKPDKTNKAGTSAGQGHELWTRVKLGALHGLRRCQTQWRLM